MKVMKIQTLLATLSTVATLAALGPSNVVGQTANSVSAAEKSGSLTEIQVAMPFRQSLFYREMDIAQALGYFKDEGLSVVFQDAGGSTPAVQQVLSENVPVANSPAAAVLVGMNRNPNIRAFYALGNRNIFDLVVPVDSDIKSVKDLVGKRLGITAFGSGEVPFVRAALSGAGLEFDGNVAIRVVSDSIPSIVNGLKSGDIDAFSGAVTETLPVTLAGVEVRSILPHDLSVLPSNTLFARDETLQSPDGRRMLVGLARGLAKAEYFAKINPDASLCISKKAVPEDHQDPEFVRSFYKVLAELKAPLSLEKYGEQSVDGWERLQGVLYQPDAGQLDSPLKSPVEDLKSKVTNELIPEINDWDRAAIQNQSKEMIVKYPGC